MRRGLFYFILWCVMIPQFYAQTSSLNFGSILSKNNDTLEVELIFNNKSSDTLAGFQFDITNVKILSYSGGDVQSHFWDFGRNWAQIALIWRFGPG